MFRQIFPSWLDVAYAILAITFHLSPVLLIYQQYNYNLVAWIMYP